MPTRLTWVTPPPAGVAELVSAQMTPYCSPGAASGDTLMVTVDIALALAARSVSAGSTAVQVVSALTTWTAVDPAETDLAASAKAMSTVTINVSPDAAPGEQ